MTPKEARERRAAGRARRRSENGSGEEHDERTGLSHDALKILASAAARGAAQALAERRRREPDEDETESPAPDAVAEPEPEPETHTEPELEDEPELEREPEPASEEEEEPEPEPMPAGELQSLVRSARAILRDLHGADAESVSSVSRSANGWTVGLEVLELQRIPDSMDVLATYEVEIDGDGNVLRFERGQRYTRSQAGRRGAE